MAGILYIELGGKTLLGMLPLLPHIELFIYLHVMTGPCDSIVWTAINRWPIYTQHLWD